MNGSSHYGLSHVIMWWHAAIPLLTKQEFKSAIKDVEALNS